MNLAALHLRWDLMVPELIVVCVATLVLLVDTAVKGPDQDRRGLQVALAAGGCLLAAAYAALALGGVLDPRLAFGGLFLVDGPAVFFKVVVLVSAALSILLSDRWLRDHRLTSGGFLGLMLFSTAGMLYMISAADLLMLFLGLEVMSIPIYVLAASERRNERSVEAGVKYLVLGSLATGFMLFGMSLLYGYTGLAGGAPSLSIAAITDLLASGGEVPAYAAAGGVLVFVGMAFKVSAVPFHMWTPDVYEGAPMPVTAFMSVAVKATAFAATLRVFTAGVLDALDLHAVLVALAALTMVVGNVAALAQPSIKRMLAYSSIAHAGYMLLGLLAGTPDGLAAVLFYSLGYAVTNLAAFGVLIYFGERGHEVESFDQVRGLGLRYPFAGTVLAVAMLSLMGMPPLVGFWGKFALFRAVVFAGFPGALALAVLGVLMSAVSAYYYLRVIVVSFMSEPSGAVPAHTENAPHQFGTLAAAALTVLIGLAPSAFLSLAERSVEAYERRPVRVGVVEAGGVP